MTPAQVHIRVQVLSNVGKLPRRTVGAPGTHGAGVTGMHGTGVGTPRAAAVAAMNIGFEGLKHIPNGMMFTIGIWSMILASGTLLVITLFVGNTTRELGAIPKLHIIIAPIQTCNGIYFYLRSFPCNFVLVTKRSAK
jgi:hypothetical protein